MSLSTTYTKVETDYLLQELQAELASGIKGELVISDTAPTAQGLYILSDVGTYTNLGGLVTTAGKVNYAYFNGTTWSKVEVASPSGKSAYEIAVANGFVGTEAQWLASLKPAVLQTMGTSTTDTMSQNAVSGLTTSEAIQLLSVHDTELVFQGFANTTTATPAHVKNNAWIVTESGTIFGITAVKGQVIKSNGTAYVAEYFSIDDVGKYTNILDPGQFLDGYAYNFSNGVLFQLAGSTATGHQRVLPNKKYTIRCRLTGEAFAVMMYFYDRNKTFITNTSNNPELVTSSDSGKTKIFTTPSNCYFIAFCRYSTSLNDFTNNVTLTQGEEWYEWSSYKSKLISHYKANKTDVAAYPTRMDGIDATILSHLPLIDAKASTDDTVLPNRVNSLETSAVPSFIGNVGGVGLISRHEIDTISPFRKYGQGYLRYMYSDTNVNGNCFIYHNLPVGSASARPSRIEWAFWVQDTNAKECWPAGTGMSFSLNDGLGIYIPNFNTFIDTTGNKTTTVVRTGSTSTMFSDYTFYFEVLAKYKGWTKVVLRMYNLVWKPAFTGTVASGWLLHWSNQNSNLYNKKFYFTNFEVFHDYEIPSGKLYVYPSADGISKFPMDIEGDIIELKNDSITLESGFAAIDQRVTALEAQEQKNEVLYTGGGVYMRSYFSTSKDIVIKLSLYGNVQSSLINKLDSITTAGTILTPMSDDGSPISISGIGYVGGNHGLSPVREITSSGHGKTISDVGSVWVDSNGVEHVILKIVSTSKIYTLSKNYGTSVIPVFKYPTAGTSLVHVSGAVNTANIPVTSLTSYQLPSRRDESYTVRFDGTIVSENATPSTAKKAEIIESYGISDPITMLERLIANKPAGGYTTQPDLTIGDSLFHITNTYTIKDGGYFITAEIEFKKAVSIGYWGMWQRGFYNPIKTVGNALYDDTISDSYKRYYPKMLPIDVGYAGGASDFRLGVAIDSPYTAEKVATSSYFEVPTSPPDRCVDIIRNSAGFKAGSIMAYLPIGVGTPNRNTNVSSAWYLFTTRKNYPYAIDNILNVGGSVPLGTYKQGVVASKWVNLENETDRTFHTLFEHEGVVYLYVDYHQSVIDKITVPEAYKGKRVTVVEKSTNVNVLTDIVTDSVRLSCIIGTPAYGYAVLKIQ